MIDADEAARILLTLCRSRPLPPKRSVVEAMEREERVFIRVPRQKRSRRRYIIHKAASSSSSTAIVENVSKEDPGAHIHNGPLMESPTKPTKNRKKRPPRFPPMEKQSKKAKRSTDRCLAAEASSSGTREPTPEWLLRLIKSKNGAEPKKIIDKELTATDLSSGHNRLSMPFSSIVDLGFLNPAEERIIQEHVRKILKKGVDAKLVGSDLREFDVNLRRWNMKKKSGGYTPVYNLVTGWNRVVQDCGLKEKDNIHLWSFHSDGILYFALVPPPPPPPSDSGKSKSEETSSALVIYDKSINDLPSK